MCIDTEGLDQPYMDTQILLLQVFLYASLYLGTVVNIIPNVPTSNFNIVGFK